MSDPQRRGKYNLSFQRSLPPLFAIVFARLKSGDSDDYQPDRDGAARNLSKTSLIRSGVSFLPLAALSIGPMD
jgi:hypothetical protein